VCVCVCVCVYIYFYIKQFLTWFTQIVLSLCFIRAGDCLLGIDDTDLLGLKIKDIAILIRNEEGVRDLNFFIWRYTYQKEEQNDIGLALKGPLPNVAKNLANALSGTVRMYPIT